MNLQATHDLKIGDVLKCRKGLAWACVGTTETGSGPSTVFVRDTTGLKGTNLLADRMFIKTFQTTEAFLKYFENANAFQR